MPGESPGVNRSCGRADAGIPTEKSQMKEEVLTTEQLAEKVAQAIEKMSEEEKARFREEFRKPSKD